MAGTLMRYPNSRTLLRTRKVLSRKPRRLQRMHPIKWVTQYCYLLTQERGISIRFTRSRGNHQPQVNGGMMAGIGAVAGIFQQIWNQYQQPDVHPMLRMLHTMNHMMNPWGNSTRFWCRCWVGQWRGLWWWSWKNFGGFDGGAMHLDLRSCGRCKWQQLKWQWHQQM